MELTHEHIVTITEMKQLPPLLERHSDFTVWTLNRVRKFNKDLRFSFGTHMADTCLSIQDGLVDALYSSKGAVRLDKLQRVSTLLEQLRIQLRMAYNLKLINARSLHYAAQCLQEEGRMLGGWIKSEER